MIDRIVIHTNNTATITFTDRGPISVSGDGVTPIRTFLRWVLTPRIGISKEEFTRAVDLESEDTQVIVIDSEKAS